MTQPCPYITVNLPGPGTPPLQLNIRYIIAWQKLLGQGSPKTRIIVDHERNDYFDVLQSPEQITTMINEHNYRV